MTDELFSHAERLVAACRTAGMRLVTAESCTGGLIAASVTEIPGSSDVLDRGFVTYSNAAKTEMLGVPAGMIEAHGAVSQPVARAMAEGALRLSNATVAVAVTGIAGPGGGTAEKPVGLVHIAAAHRDGRRLHQARHFGDTGRAGIRHRTVRAAFEMIESLIDQAVP